MPGHLIENTSIILTGTMSLDYPLAGMASGHKTESKTGSIFHRRYVEFGGYRRLDRDLLQLLQWQAVELPASGMHAL